MVKPQEVGLIQSKALATASESRNAGACQGPKLHPAAKPSTAVSKAYRNDGKSHSKKNFRREEKIACKLQNRKKVEEKKNMR